MKCVRRRLLGVAFVLVAASIAAPGARAVAPHPIDLPMAAGTLPTCPAQLVTLTPSPVFTNYATYNQFSTFEQLGLLNNCANMNWQDPDNTSSFPVGAHTYAVPDRVSISPDPVKVVLHMDGVGAPGPFNTDYPSCMPLSTRSGGCKSLGDDRVFVAYRLANNDGSFSGNYTLAGVPGSPNPYFDLTRGSCPNNWGSWSSGYETLGFPCPWTLRFTTDVTGKPALGRAMQVVIEAAGRSGTKSAHDITGPKYSVEGVISMLFTPGASSSLTLASSPSSVRSGKTATLTAHAVGPAAGAAVNFYRSVARGPWTFVGSSLTNTKNNALLSVKPSVTTSYRARLVSNGTETVTTGSLPVAVTRALTLKSTRLRAKVYQFTATVSPRAGASKTQLQRLAKGKWKTVRTASGTSGKCKFTLKLPAGSSSWRVMTPTTASYAASTSSTKRIKRH